MSATVPKTPTIKKIELKSKRHIFVLFESVNCDYFQYQVATNSSFTQGVKNYIYVHYNSSGAKSVLVYLKSNSNLVVGKKYYVRIRACKIDDLNKKHFGFWCGYHYITCRDVKNSVSNSILVISEASSKDLNRFVNN